MSTFGLSLCPVLTGGSPTDRPGNLLAAVRVFFWLLHPSTALLVPISLEQGTPETFVRSGFAPAARRSSVSLCIHVPRITTTRASPSTERTSRNFRRRGIRCRSRAGRAMGKAMVRGTRHRAILVMHVIHAARMAGTGRSGRTAGMARRIRMGPSRAIPRVTRSMRLHSIRRAIRPAG